MSGADFARLLDCYGQTVTLVPGDGSEPREARAFVQPIRERREETHPSPLGMGRQDRFLYLGEPGAPLDGLAGGYVAWNGRTLRVMNGHGIYVGGTLSHWWAVLTARDPDEGGDGV